MGPALANLERLLLDQHVVHDNPVLSMCASHTTTRMDAAGNRAPDKKPSHPQDRRDRRADHESGDGTDTAGADMH